MTQQPDGVPPSVGRLSDSYDALLVDLDGTLYRGNEAIPGAVEALGASGRPVVYVTNNASKSPADTAAHLRQLGFPAHSTDVITSAEAAVGLAIAQVGAGSRALIVGAESFRELASAAGLEVVRSADDRPDIVLQGLSRELNWADLAEGCLAIRAGAQWIASNIDTTLPSERGLLPGNGALVAALAASTGAQPLVAGKPAPGAFLTAAQRVGSHRPLAVGDRLDTDVQGAVAAGFDCLMVLTGVSAVADLLGAPPALRPTHLAAGLEALGAPDAASRIAPAVGVETSIVDGALVVGETELEGLGLARAVVAAAWECGVGRISPDSKDRDRLEAAGVPVG